MPKERHYIHGDPCEANDGTYYCASRDLFVQFHELDLGEKGYKKYEWMVEVAETRNPARWRVIFNARGNPYVGGRPMPCGPRTRR